MDQDPSSGVRQETKAGEDTSADLTQQLAERVVGQPSALKLISPYIDMYRAGLAPEGRPAGIFLLLGPTGTGKTKTVEALAGILHGSEKNVLRIDCGEFQMEHEVAKLIGSPPGYLGHRETAPLLNQQRLAAVASEKCDLAIVLFDEIEKAAGSLVRLLLGILDKAALRLGDNTSVNFEKTIIFLTSNLGAREMMKEISPDFGFGTAVPAEDLELSKKLENVAMGAVRRKFPPEFVNRIDAVITYQPLDAAALEAILDRQINELQQHVNTRLAAKCFSIEVPPETRKFLLEHGTSKEYGARELKRTIHRHLTQPLATMVASGGIEPGASVRFIVAEDGQSILIRPGGLHPATEGAQPVVLLVDDNRDLLRLFSLYLSQGTWTILTAESGAEAKAVCAKQIPDLIVFDYLLPDGNGIELAMAIRSEHPRVEIIIATGAEMSNTDQARCERNGFPVLRKPFFAEELSHLIRFYLSKRSAAAS